MILKAVGDRATVEVNKEKVGRRFMGYRFCCLVFFFIAIASLFANSVIALELRWNLLRWLAQPGKGNFVVRVEGVEKPIVNLVGMARPFAALKALDMDEICKKVIEAIEA